MGRMEKKMKKVIREIHTTLAMVHTYPDGDRDFSFYRNPESSISEHCL